MTTTKHLFEPRDDDPRKCALCDLSAGNYWHADVPLMRGFTTELVKTDKLYLTVPELVNCLNEVQEKHLAFYMYSSDDVNENMIHHIVSETITDVIESILKASKVT